MKGFNYKTSLVIFLVSLFSVQAFSQQINYRDSIAVDNSQKVLFKPQFHYSVGSTFLYVPHVGSVTGVTMTPFLSVPLSPKLSVEGGIIAGRYYSSFGSNNELRLNGGFNSISLFGSATYHFNQQLTLYGAGIKQVTNNSPFNMLPKSSYIIGSNYNFGSFSIGLSVEMSKWNNNLNTLPFNNSQGLSPFDRTSTFLPIGR
jgi:hypothetical protein